MLLLPHVLMLSLLSGGLARVVEDFKSECGQFFANGISPTKFPGPQYKQICQMRNYVDYYATFYDTFNKIPVYSAYKFEGIGHCRRQIDDNYAGPNMASEGSVNIQIHGDRQALNRDYYHSGYDKGHLAPVYQSFSQSCASATFTLTNAAPQVIRFNRGKWRNIENHLAKHLERACYFKPVYIVTGVVPGNYSINNRVNVPSHFWTAYCCLDQNNRCSHSGGVTGTNENYSNITKMNVANLETVLGQLYGLTFTLFH
uniref:Endonuclease domain-containing 1 protein-like n=1 Tax=Cyprinus carpio carpio TaxID=630221 RepID=A0A9J7Y463_CYPCA